jgi:predicted amidohydrolase YtcJ
MSPAVFFGMINPGSLDFDFGRMVQHGARITIGSDYADKDRMPDPLAACAVVQERLASNLPRPDVGDGRSKAAQLLCHFLTLNGAHSVGNPEQFGSIVVGKEANFIITSQDLSHDGFDGAKVLETWFEGKNVYRRKQSL